MKAIIYAAGLATRLGPAFARHPKILLEFAGRTLLEWHAKRLSDIGVRELHVVTGHERAKVAATLDQIANRHDLKLHEIVNPDFREGSAVSMLVSLPVIETAGDRILLLDGDVLYGPTLLPRLVASPHRSALLLDQAYATVDDDPVLVPVRNGRPFEFMKKWRGAAELLGESVGLFKLDAGDIPLLAAETRLRGVGSGRLESYDEVLRALVRAGRLGFEDVTGMPWTEIDFPHDVEFARNHVLPTILAETAPPVRN